MGWEQFNRIPYNELKAQLHHGTSCADCHDPNTMKLRINRPAFRAAMAARGIDVDKASQQEMRLYVCGQCHVEYCFKGADKLLTFPWNKGLTIDDIEAYYEEQGFSDWEHKDTGAQMIKIQHPEFEMFSTGVHAKMTVACPDCHMPRVSEGSSSYTNHWIRSPLVRKDLVCSNCHSDGDKQRLGKVARIQGRTAAQLRAAEEALISAIDAIAAIDLAQQARPAANAAIGK